MAPPNKIKCSTAKSSCAYTSFGIMFYITGILTLLLNEKRAVETSKSLNTALEGIQNVQSIDLVNPDNEGKLVYIYGSIHVEEPLTEPEYGISVPAVILKRRVQMYQWVELEENNSNGNEDQSVLDRKYTYLSEWRDKLVDSNKFGYPTGHHNPKSFPINSGIYISDVVKIGAFILSDNLKRKFNDFTLITSDERPERRDIKMHAGLYYHTLDVWNPEVGDTRVQFSYAGNSGDVVSIIARQSGSQLGGSGLVMLEPGKIPAEQIITNQHSKNVWMIRFYRLVGWLCMYVSTTFFKQLIQHLGELGFLNEQCWNGVLSLLYLIHQGFQEGLSFAATLIMTAKQCVNSSVDSKLHQSLLIN